MLSILALTLIAADPPPAATAQPPKTTDHGPRTTDKPVWTPKDKEMVVLLGSAFIEQEARDGYLETELIRLFPNKDIRVRNLGWSGDTVHCQARSYFGPPQEGFDRLRGHLAMIKPTTVICCYGANESWKGEPGIPDFRRGYEKLIDMIREATGATVVLMTPPAYEPKGAAKERLEAANVQLRRYWHEIKYIADGHKYAFMNFGQTLDSLADEFRVRARTESDGVTFISAAYNVASKHVWSEPAPLGTQVTQVDFNAMTIESYNGSRITNVAKNGLKLSWTQTTPQLHFAHPHFIQPRPSRGTAYELRVDGEILQIERYSEKEIVAIDPESKQYDQLRLAIIKKNALFFHRWRPANETYLFGFRKHEQGNNGVEPPMFDKLVEEAEAEIAKLKKPVPHKYELIRVEEKK